MKKRIYLFISILMIFILVGCEKENNNVENINVQKLESIQQENKEETNLNNTILEDNIISEKKEPIEELLYSFSTQLLAKEENRVDNISKACNTINGIIINSGETFSFWSIIGNPTVDKGYKEAKAFTASGGVTTAIGGGLCQVSSTIYNIVLNVPELETIERHQHTREVYYVKLGNDASVSYGGADFKFKNNLPNPIKIYAECTNEEVNIRFVKLL